MQCKIVPVKCKRNFHFSQVNKTSRTSFYTTFKVLQAPSTSQPRTTSRFVHQTSSLRQALKSPILINQFVAFRFPFLGYAWARLSISHPDACLMIGSTGNSSAWTASRCLMLFRQIVSYGPIQANSIQHQSAILLPIESAISLAQDIKVYWSNLFLRQHVASVQFSHSRMIAKENYYVNMVASLKRYCNDVTKKDITNPTQQAKKLAIANTKLQHHHICSLCAFVTTSPQLHFLAVLRSLCDPTKDVPKTRFKVSTTPIPPPLLHSFLINGTSAKWYRGSLPLQPALKRFHNK